MAVNGSPFSLRQSAFASDWDATPAAALPLPPGHSTTTAAGGGGLRTRRTAARKEDTTVGAKGRPAA